MLPIPQMWLLIFVGLLLVTNALSINMYLGKRDELAVVSEQMDAIKVAKEDAEKLSAQTVKDINHAIPLLLESTEKNALENYRRRYGVGVNAPVGCVSVGDNRGSGFNGGWVLNNSGSGSETDISKIPSGKASVVAPSGSCDPRFINDAARAAAIMHGIDLWIDSNAIPREK